MRQDKKVFFKDYDELRWLRWMLPLSVWAASICVTSEYLSTFLVVICIIC